MGWCGLHLFDWQIGDHAQLRPRCRFSGSLWYVLLQLACCVLQTCYLHVACCFLYCSCNRGFRGHSVSPNMVPFHMLRMVSYCAIVILSAFEIFDFKNEWIRLFANEGSIHTHRHKVYKIDRGQNYTEKNYIELTKQS